VGGVLLAFFKSCPTRISFLQAFFFIPVLKKKAFSLKQAKK